VFFDSITVRNVRSTIACAHYVASSRDGSGPKMRFAFPFTVGGVTEYSVWRISDGGPAGPDTVLADGVALTLADAVAWVNKGQDVGYAARNVIPSSAIQPSLSSVYTSPTSAMTFPLASTVMRPNALLLTLEKTEVSAGR
jgi:branched-subunit amino acid ABC-type transport system permease component